MKRGGQPGPPRRGDCRETAPGSPAAALPPIAAGFGRVSTYDAAMAIDPTSLEIRIHPDPVLRRVADPIPAVTDEVRAVARAMVELMRSADGIGLAAPQVGIPWRLFVVDVPPSEKRSPDSDPPTATRGPVIYINPRLTVSGPTAAGEEGCLSLPDIHGDVIRPTIVEIEATDLEGQRFTQRGTGLLGVCWQHENDHLDGVLIIDKMTQLSRLKNRSALRELEREGARRAERDGKRRF